MYFHRKHMNTSSSGRKSFDFLEQLHIQSSHTKMEINDFFFHRHGDAMMSAEGSGDKGRISLTVGCIAMVAVV